MLIIKYCEIYYKDGNCVPYLELGYDKNSKLPNLKAISKNMNEDRYISFFVNLKYGFFDSLSKQTIDILDDIFISTKQTYLNKKIWSKYLKDNFPKVPTMEIKPIIASTNNIKRNNKNNDWVLKPILIFPNDTEMEEIYNHSEFPQLNINYKISHITLSVENEEELLYTFLYIIFNSDFSYDIIKCNNCQKYMLATKSDTEYCERIYKNNLNCSQFRKHINKIKRNSTSSAIDILRQRVYEKLKKQGQKDKKYDKGVNTILKEFHQNENEILKQCYNNNGGKIRFYLSYYSDKRKQEIIEELGLFTYL
jgi:hypothetical protein